jgi:hypothetical protein
MCDIATPLDQPTMNNAVAQRDTEREVVQVERTRRNEKQPVEKSECHCRCGHSLAALLPATSLSLSLCVCLSDNIALWLLHPLSIVVVCLGLVMEKLHHTQRLRWGLGLRPVVSIATFVVVVIVLGLARCSTCTTTPTDTLRTSNAHSPSSDMPDVTRRQTEWLVAQQRRRGAIVMTTETFPKLTASVRNADTPEYAATMQWLHHLVHGVEKH